jgi:hypothetical protein
MSKKAFPILLGVCIIAFGMTSSAASAWIPGSGNSADQVLPYLRPELVVSNLDNLQFSPSIAYNSKHHEYLVVWENVWSNNLHDIQGQRITESGQLIGPSPIHIASGSKNKMQPDVAYDPVNDRYLVVWIHDINGDGSNWDISGRFIPWENSTPTLSEFKICDWSSNQWEPRLEYARAQEEFLVVWMNTPPSIASYISARRIKALDGSFPANGFTISSGTQTRDNPEVAYNLARNEYLVTFDVGSSSLDIHAVRLSGNGTALGGGEFPIAGWPDNEINPAVAACEKADQYLVAWQSLVGSDYDIYARFVKGDGTPDSVYEISGFAGHQEQVQVSCNFEGREYMLTWQEHIINTGISGRLVSTDKQLGPGFQVIAPVPGTGNAYPGLASGRVNHLVSWEHPRSGTAYQDIHGRLISPHSIFLPVTVQNH